MFYSSESPEPIGDLAAETYRVIRLAMLEEVYLKLGKAIDALHADDQTAYAFAIDEMRRVRLGAMRMIGLDAN